MFRVSIVSLVKALGYRLNKSSLLHHDAHSMSSNLLSTLSLTDWTASRTLTLIEVSLAAAGGWVECGCVDVPRAGGIDCAK